MKRVPSARLRERFAFYSSKANSLASRSILHNISCYASRRFSGREITPISPRFVGSGRREEAAQTSAFPGKTTTMSRLISRGADCKGRSDVLSSTGLHPTMGGVRACGGEAWTFSILTMSAGDRWLV